MAICKHCSGEITLSPTHGNKCPACGKDLNSSPLYLGPSDSFELAPHEDAFRAEIADGTVAFTPSGDTSLIEDSSVKADSKSGIPEVELDFTHVFGGKELEEIALDKAFSPDGTQALGSDRVSDKPPSRTPDNTARRPGDSTSPDTTHVAGAPPGESSGRTDWPTGVTMPVGLSGSDRPGSDRADSGSLDTHREDETILQDSGTQAIGSGRKSSQVHTPQSREITGLSSGRTIPRGPLGEGGASRSLKAGDVQVIGPEQIRLRAFGLSEGLENEQDVDFLLRGSAGKGGMGIVYRSLQRSLDRDVAVKQMKPDLADSESDRNKFLTEAVITGQLEHPNIIPVHELGLASDGLPFYAMKFVIGDDWEDRLKKLGEQENLSILIQVANAIAFAHSRNVIHRDLKPGNVRLGNFGEVLVMDWGLAARLDRDGDIPPAGTPLYMAPETALEYLDHVKQQQTSGIKTSSTRRIKAGTYSDIYLLGALLFKIITGKAPHSGKTPFECLRNAARNKIVKVDRTSELLDIAYKAMATNPADRYRSVVEFVDAVKAYQSHAQSIQIARRAADDLADAEEQRNTPGVDSTATYAIFSSAQHGFQNALDLWPENRKAKEQLARCRQVFAETAYNNGDYAQALSLLDFESEADVELVTKIRRSQKQRQSRLAWFKTLQYATAASLMLALAFIGYSVYARNDAYNQRQIARKAQVAANEASTLAQEQQSLADAAGKEALEKSALAAKNQQEAEQAAALAKQESAAAQAARTEAAKATGEARQAQATAAQEQAKAAEAQRIAQYQEYRAKQGEVYSTLLSDGDYAAWKLIQEVDPQLIASGNEKDKLEWTALVNDSDWTKEAKELDAVRLAQPRLAVSPDGKWLAVAGSDADAPQLLVFNTNDLATPRQTVKLAVPAERLAISPNGQFVATASDELHGGQLSVVDLQTGSALKQVKNNGGDAGAKSSRITSVAFDPASQRILTGDTGTALAEWVIDAANGTLARVYRDEIMHREQVAAVGYSPDGQLAFSADRGGVLRVWERANDDTLRLKSTYSHQDVAFGSAEITAAALSDATGDYVPLAYGTSDGSVYLVHFPNSQSVPVAAERRLRPGQLVSKQASLKSNQSAWEIDSNIKPEKLSLGHGGSVTNISFAKEGAVLISSGMDKLLVQDVSDVATSDREPMRRYHDATVLSSAAGAGDFAYSSDEKGRVLQWKIDVPRSIREFNPDSRGTSEVTAIDVQSGEELRVAVADSGGVTRVWSGTGGQETPSQLFVGHSDHGRMEAWHIPGDEPLIVTVADDRRACLWDAGTGFLQRTIDLGDRPVVAISAAGDALLAATDRTGVKAQSFALDRIDHQPLWQNEPRVSAILPLCRASDDEQTIAIGLRDGQIYLWRSDRERAVLAEPVNRPHWRPIRFFAYDSSADVLYAADTVGLISRWPLDPEKATARSDRPLNAKQAESVARLEVSPDGRRLLAVVTVRGLHELRLLDSSSLEPIAEQPTPLRGIVDAAFAPDGQSPLVVSTGSTIQHWNLATHCWQPSELSGKVANALRRGQRVTGVRFDSVGNVLVYGPGFAQLWNGWSEDAELVSRVRSRPPVQLVEFRAGNAEVVRLLDDDGRLDRWCRSDGHDFEPAEEFSTALRGVVQACPAGTSGEAYLAIRDANDQPTRIELWNLDAGQRVKGVGEPVRGTCDSLAVAPDRVAYAGFADGRSWIQVTDIESGKTTSEIELPAGQRAASLALAPTDERVLICTPSGRAYVASPDNADQWSVTAIDRDDVSAAIFSPHGERLILGTKAGQVYIAKPQASEVSIAARLLLALPGHSDRITTLKLAEHESKLALFSGDAAGRVLLHPLE